MKITSLFLLLASITACWGAEQRPDGYYHTGDGIQTAAHWPFTMKLFSVAHDSKVLPPTKSPHAMIELDADKRLTLHMLRNIGTEHFKSGLTNMYKVNQYTDLTQIDRFLTPLSDAALAEGAKITITYDAQHKATTLEVPGAPPSRIEGVEFMRATWSIWFANSKPADLGEQLLAGL